MSSRAKLLSDEYLLAKFCFDAAENEPLEIWNLDWNLEILTGEKFLFQFQKSVGIGNLNCGASDPSRKGVIVLLRAPAGGRSWRRSWPLPGGCRLLLRGEEAAMLGESRPTSRTYRSCMPLSVKEYLSWSLWRHYNKLEISKETRRVPEKQ